jgi:hypothetical protein
VKKPVVVSDAAAPIGSTAGAGEEGRPLVSRRVLRRTRVA